MSVDPAWLEQVRLKNQEKFGMAGSGMGGLGYVSASALNEAMRREQELRTGAIHAGRFEREDPNKPEEGSIESIAQALAPPPEFLQAPLTPVKSKTFWIGLVAAVSLGLAILVARRRS